MAPSRKLITVSGTEHGMALLDFIAKRLALSNKQSKRLLDARSVFVNEQRVWMARHPVSVGDHVEVQDDTIQLPEMKCPPILHEDDEYLIVDKPAGLLANGPQSAESVLRTVLRRNVYAVHRLDRETSGCLLLSKTVPARDAMKPLFQARELTKIYNALAIGSFPKTLHAIREPIDNQTAITHVQVLKANATASFLELSLETGRTHQIRKHLSHVGHAVVGDKSYASHAITSPALRRAGRQMLHAARLEFAHPRTGVRIAAQAPLPPDFKACQASLQLR